MALELAQPGSVNDEEVRARIAGARPDAICVCAFGALISEPLLSEYLMLNVHPSLLPRWRGAAPIERAIMAGDVRTGVSIMRVTAGLDSGPVYAQAAEPIDPADTYGTLAVRLMRLGGELLVDTLSELPPWSEQDERQATYAEKIIAADRRLDPGRPAEVLERVVRALTPHIGAQLELSDGALLGVREVRVLASGPPAGTLVLEPPHPVLGCAQGALELCAVHPSGRRLMSGEEYLRGLHR